MSFGAEEVVINVIANDQASYVLNDIISRLNAIRRISTNIAQNFVQQPTTPPIQDPSRLLPPAQGTSTSQTPSKEDSSQTRLDDFNTKEVDKADKKVKDFRKNVSKPLKQAKLEDYGTGSVKTTTESVNTMNTTISNANKSVNTLGGQYKTLGKEGTASLNKVNSGLQIGMSSFHTLNNLLIAVGGQFTNLASQIAGLFGANSLSGMFEKMWKGAADRQTNMLYLIHQKGVSEANRYYTEIMDIVTQLPGDDTFLTNLLNMASGLDENIKVDNLKELGSAITDFYIASTMKGELPFETERDIRKYVLTGDTRGLRNSIIANEIDLLKNKNSVLERGQALQKALEKTGLTGISGYESATNELEEFKGHFQKAFADLGTLVLAVTQPLLKLYNAMDTIFGSRLSQLIILVGVAFIGLFTVIGTGMIFTSVFLRNFEMIGSVLYAFGNITRYASSSQSLLNLVTLQAIGVDADYAVANNITIGTEIRKAKVTLESIISKKLYTIATSEQTFSVWGLFTATASLLKAKIINIATSIKEIILGVDEIALSSAKTVLKRAETDATITETAVNKAQNIVTRESIHLKLMKVIATLKNTLMLIPNIILESRKRNITLKEAFAEKFNTYAKNSNTIATIRNTLSKMKDVIQDAISISIKLAKAVITWLTTGSTLSEALAHEFDTIAKIMDTEATLGLAGATAILEAVLAPLLVIVIAIVLVIIGLAIVVEKVGEAFGWWKDSGEALSKTLNTLIKIMFPLLGIIETIGEALGWWKDFGSMFEAIGDGIKRLWNAFRLSEPVQGIIKYFGDFIATIQDVIGSILDLFGALFGWEDTGETFDIVQMIINAFGKLGEIIKWVWNLMDDFSNSPLGILTWLNPITILIFHLDELGSFFEDVRDAIDRFTESAEFQDLINSFNEVFTELQEPFQEIWSLIEEIIGLFGEIFSADDPEGQGTEDRINFLVEILKGVAYVIKVVVIPAIKLLVAIIKIVTLPIKIILTVIRDIIKAVSQATSLLDIFGIAWQILTLPLTLVQKLLEGIGDVINTVSDAIKNSIIGKLLGWDKEADEENNPESKKELARNNLYDSMKDSVGASDMDIVTKHQILGELDSQKNSNNVNDVRNLGSTYNNRNNNNGNIIVNQNFNEGSMPIDARNMTKKDVRKLFVGAFGYRRAVGSKGILR